MESEPPCAARKKYEKEMIFISNVLKKDRKDSGLEFYINAIKLRKSLTTLLLKDFGIRNKVRRVESFTANWDDEDIQVFEEMADKYDLTNIIDEYPDWFIGYCRENILSLSRDLVWTVTEAYSIFPYYESEFYEKRRLQDKCIGICEQLLQEFQYIISIIPCDANKYLSYVNMIEDEIDFLKAWRKSSNKDLKKK